MSKNLIRTTLTVLSIMGFYLLAVGCEEPSYTYTPPRWSDATNYAATKPIRGGFIPENATITKIEAEDKSFTLIRGQEFEAPFQSTMWNCLDRGRGNLVDKAATAIGCGAKRVDVYVEGRDTPYYGILALNPAIEAAFGPASRSYLLNLTPRVLANANNGNTAVAFEYMKFEKTERSNTGLSRKNNNQYYGWIIWISTYPIR